jgi:PKD domain-containing protein/Big-like domain-containing protein
MTTRDIAAVLVIGALTASTAGAQGVEIDHKAVGCIVVGKYPKMNACFNPGPNLARGRVYFRPEGATSWYYVEMKSDQPCYAGILPRPGKKLVGKKIEYYVEGQDKTFNASRTAEYDPIVVKSAQECKKDIPVAPFLNNAAVAVFPAVPAGFVAGGAIGTGAVLGIVGAGAAAAGTAVAVSSSKNNDTTTTTIVTGVTPTTTLPAPTTTTTTLAKATNHPPNAILKTNPDPPTGKSPLTVNFDLCSSTDPDGDPLSYFFDFGDGTQTSGACSVSHTYTATSFRGPNSLSGGVSAKSTTYNFLGSVVDPSGASQSRARSVVVDACQTPTVTITAPMGCVAVNFSSVVPVSADASDATNVHFSLDYIGFNCNYPASNVGMTDVGGTTNPYSTSFDTNKFGTGCYKLTAQASNACGTRVDASPVVFTTSYGCGGLRLTTADRGSLGWSSDLALDGGRLQIVVNAASASFPGRGRSYGVASLRGAENRVEATVVEAAGKPGLWRFDVMNAENVVAGSIHVLAGDVVNIAASSITFRLHGTPGERVSFTFQKK